MTIINKLSVLLSVWLCMACSSSQDTVSDVSLTDYVEPRIGTAHCRWFHFTPGALPFGLAKPGPSTNGHIGNKWGWEATGYDYRDTSIEGFPCLHEFQEREASVPRTRLAVRRQNHKSHTM